MVWWFGSCFWLLGFVGGGVCLFWVCGFGLGGCGVGVAVLGLA